MASAKFDSPALKVGIANQRHPLLTRSDSSQHNSTKETGISKWNKEQ
jgi:hypothetical protein